MRFDLVAVATPDQVQAGGERPQDPATVAVELVVGVRRRRVVAASPAGAHPKMPPVELSVVVVVETTLPSIWRMRCEHLVVERLGLDGVALGLGQELLVRGAGVEALVAPPCPRARRPS